ncbi:hypothetical protein [Burkholderia ubonensis]
MAQNTVQAIHIAVVATVAASDSALTSAGIALCQRRSRQRCARREKKR